MEGDVFIEMHSLAPSGSRNPSTCVIAHFIPFLLNKDLRLNSWLEFDEMTLWEEFDVLVGASSSLGAAVTQWNGPGRCCCCCIVRAAIVSCSVAPLWLQFICFARRSAGLCLLLETSYLLIELSLAPSQRPRSLWLRHWHCFRDAILLFDDTHRLS